MEEYLTVDEAARVLRLTRWTIYRYVKTGVLPARQIVRRLYIPRTAIEALLQRAPQEDQQGDRR